MSVTVEVRDGISIVTMDDGKANALGESISGPIGASLSAAEADPEIRAMVLAGREGRFCGGFDLSVISGGDLAATLAMVKRGGELVHHLYGASIPVVAACTGHAVAAGALLLLGCDHRVGPDAPIKVGLNEVAIGLTLPGWAHTIARERLSRRHLQLSVVNARLYDGVGATAAGFLDEVVEPSLVLETAIERAIELSALDPTAYGKTVRAMRGSVLDEMAASLR